MLKLSCILTGDDYQSVMNDTPSSKKKIKLLASCLFIPTIVWMINGYLLTRQVLDCQLYTSIITMLVSGFLIFSIERAIIAVSAEGRNRYIILASRILLGLLISVLGSLAMDEVIFKADIDDHISIYKQALNDVSIKKIKAIDSSELIKQEQIVNNKYSDWQNASIAVAKEADGSGGSGKRGVSSITKLKEQASDAKKDDYEKANSILLTMKKLQYEKIENQNKQNESNFNSGALLTRIKVLYDLISTDTSMKCVWIIFTMFFIFIEFIVIILKMCSQTTNYETKMENIERVGKRRMEEILNRDKLSFNPNEYKTEVRNAVKTLHRSNTGIY